MSGGAIGGAGIGIGMGAGVGAGGAAHGAGGGLHHGGTAPPSSTGPTSSSHVTLSSAGLAAANGPSSSMAAHPAHGTSSLNQVAPAAGLQHSGSAPNAPYDDLVAAVLLAILLKDKQA